jgi:hypothetical protein
MSPTSLASIVFVTAGAAIVGVALVRLIGGRTRPRAFAGDLLAGVGTVVGGIGLVSASGMPIMMAALALVASASLLGIHDRAYRARDRSVGAGPDRLIR